MSIEAPLNMKAPSFLKEIARIQREELSYKEKCFIYYKYVLHYNRHNIKTRLFIMNDKTYYTLNKKVKKRIEQYNTI